MQESSPKIAQYKLLTTGRDKLADLAQIIISKDYKRVMVFCNTKYNTGMLANQLARLHFNVDCLHGDLSQAERNRIMQRFKAGEINVLVATDVPFSPLGRSAPSPPERENTTIAASP